IMFIKITAALQRCAHGFKIPWRNLNLHRSNDGFSGFHRVALGKDDVFVEASAKGNARGRSSEADTGNRAKRFERTIHEWPPFFQRVFALRKCCGKGNSAVGFEAGIYGKEFLEAG